MTITERLSKVPIKRLIFDSLDVSHFIKKVAEGYRLTVEKERFVSSVSCLLEGPINDRYIVTFWGDGDPYGNGSYLGMTVIKAHIEEARRAVIEGLSANIKDFEDEAREQGYETPQIIDKTGRLEGFLGIQGVAFS